MGQNPASKYTPEFRGETADCVIASGRPATGCRRELGLNPETVNDRVPRRRRELGESAPAPTGDQAAELRAAKKRIRELEMENEFPRKAAAFPTGTQGQRSATRRWGRRGRTSR